jgi:hypothetical protein
VRPPAADPAARARAAGTQALERLIGLIGSADDRVALAAARTVLDHAFGAPAEPAVSVDPAAVSSLANLSRCDRDQLRSLLRRARG